MCPRKKICFSFQVKPHFDGNFVKLPLLLNNFSNSVPCPQGQFLNQTSTGRRICEKCPNNTYWVMRLNEEGEVIGVGCAGCPLWQTSPAGSLDFSYCTCDNENCSK